MTEDRISTAVEAANTAGKVLLKLFSGGTSRGEMKADHTLVTQADRQANQIIQDILLKHFPEDGILSEEGSTIYPSSKHVWIIDPLDGTVNFCRGLHYWGISIAHLVDGQPQNGAIYFPVTDELFTASKGKGAQLNGNPLILGDDPGEDLFPLFVHCSRMHERYVVSTRYKKRSLGAAAYHLCLVANNTAILAMESTPRIWDISAGWLIIEEAGAAIKSLGTEHPFPAQPGLDYGKKPYPVLAARSEALLAEAAEGINPKEGIKF
jgi:myo-inositol-1(or 4)-monophosphatase